MTGIISTRPAARPRSRLGGLRVLQFCDHYGARNGGGSERVAREINRKLVDRGAALIVATAQRGAAFRDPGIPVMTRPILDLTAVAGGQLAASPGYLRWAARTVEKVAPDVLYTHSIHFHGSLVAARLSRRTGIPLVGVVHVGALDSLAGRARVLAEVHERTVGRFVLGSCAEVVAVAPSAARHAARRGARTTPIVAANGVDHRRFRAGPEPGGIPTVVFVGRLVENKGPGLLVAAARALVNDGERFRVVFVGDGPLRARLARECALGSLPVDFVGHSDDVPGWLAAANVVVRPSFTEGMPLAVLEAMAASRCLVVSDIEAHRDLLRDDRAALLHRVGDANDLAAKLRSVLCDEVLRARVASHAHALASELTWDRCADAHETALASAARRRDEQAAHR